MHYFVSFLVFAIILTRERDGFFALIVLCLVTVNVLWLFSTVSWLSLQCVIEEFPDHTHLLFVLVSYSQ